MADRLRILESLEGVEAARWDALAGGNPTVSHAFLDSLHRTGCASARSGSKLLTPASEQYAVLASGESRVTVSRMQRSGRPSRRMR